MRNRFVWFFVLSAFCSVLAFDRDLFNFKMQDQFKNTHTRNQFLGSVVVVLGSDKDGSQYNTAWGKALSDSLREEERLKTVKFLPVADLRGVPFFLKGFVRGKFPKDSTTWVLTDWKGRFSKAYDLEAGACNVVIFDQTGQYIAKYAVHELEIDVLAVIVGRIRKTMAAHQIN